jgi:hypothetical protein
MKNRLHKKLIRGLGYTSGIQTMPTILTLQYTAYVQVSVPNAIARKLKEQDGVQNSEDAPFAFGNKWGDLYYQDEDGKEHKIEGETMEIDYKRTEIGEWEDEEESDGECESENEVVFVAGPPEPLAEDDYEVMPPA